MIPIRCQQHIVISQKMNLKLAKKKYRAMFLKWNQVYMPVFTYFGVHWQDVAWSTSICIPWFHSILPAKLCLVIHSYVYILAWVQLFYFIFSLQNTWDGAYFPTFHEVSTVFKQAIIWHVTYIVIYLDFHSAKRASWLVDSWSRAPGQIQMYPDRDAIEQLLSARRTWSVHD